MFPAGGRTVRPANPAIQASTRGLDGFKLAKLAARRARAGDSCVSRCIWPRPKEAALISAGIGMLDDFIAEDGALRPVRKRQWAGHVYQGGGRGVDVYCEILMRATAAAAKIEDSVA
jgi:hypothetical protein